MQVSYNENGIILLLEDQQEIDEVSKRFVLRNNVRGPNPKVAFSQQTDQFGKLTEGKYFLEIKADKVINKGD